MVRLYGGFFGGNECLHAYMHALGWVGWGVGTGDWESGLGVYGGSRNCSREHVCRLLQDR